MKHKWSSGTKRVWRNRGGDGYGCFGSMGVTILALCGGHVVVGMWSSPSGCILLGSHSFLAFVISRYVSINRNNNNNNKKKNLQFDNLLFLHLTTNFELEITIELCAKHNIIQSHNNVLLNWQYYVEHSSHSYWMWAIFCRTNNVLWNIPHIQSKWENIL